MSEKKKFIEDKFFYKLFIKSHKYLILNIGFFLTVFLWMTLGNFLSPSILGLFMYGMALFSGMISLTAINRIYYEEKINFKEPSLKRYFGVLIELIKKHGSMYSISFLLSTILLIDLYFLVFVMNLTFLIPLLFVLFSLSVVTILMALITRTTDEEITIIHAFKIGFLLTIKKWYFSLMIFGMIAFLILAINVKSELGYLMLPSFIFLYTHKMYNRMTSSLTYA